MRSANTPPTYPPLTPAFSPPPPGMTHTPVVTDHELFDRQGEFLLPQPPATAFTRALGRTVHPLEEDGHVSQLSVVRLRDRLTPVLHTKHTEQTASDAEWVSAVVDLTDEYLVVTDQGVYRALAPRAHLSGALLKALVLSVMGDRP